MVTLECVEKLIRKDMVDPVNGEKLTDRDIIVLQRVSRPVRDALLASPLRGSAPPTQTPPPETPPSSQSPARPRLTFPDPTLPNPFP